MLPTIFAEPSRDFSYQIEHKIGSGMMGVVYKATDVQLERAVAIKFLREEASELDDVTRQRFLQEARAAAALSHPGVTTVHQVGELEGNPFIVMEWLQGRDLQEVVDRDAPLDLERVLAITLELLEVLDVAHRSRIVHRDIKPANLFELEGGRIKVTDFGIARIQDRSLVQTAIGAVMATPRFASPEQLQGRAVDGRSDLFSTGVVAYNLLTNNFPWTGASLGDLIHSVTQKPSTAIREHRRDLPAELDTWFQKVLARDPENRFRGAAAMAESLERAAQGASASQTLVHSPSATSTSGSWHLTAPSTVFEVREKQQAGSALVELVTSWEARPLGTMAQGELLDRLLEKPLHTDAFTGAALYGGHCLLVEDGLLLAAIDHAARPDRDASLPESAETVLYPMPKACQCGDLALLTTLLEPPPPTHSDLDSSVVDLTAFLARSLAKGFEGVARIEGPEGMALLTLRGREIGLAVLAGTWGDDPRILGWEPWLRREGLTADLYPRQVRPPWLWYPRRFRNLAIDVEPIVTPDKPKDPSLTGTLATVATDRELFETSSLPIARHFGASLSAAESPIARFGRWLLSQLPRQLVEQRRATSWKYLADWLLLVRQLRLHTRVPRPGSGEDDVFDLLTFDGRGRGPAPGKLLHVADRLAQVGADEVRDFADRVLAAKEARIEGGDIGGAFLVSPRFDASAFEVYGSLLHRGLGNKLLGLDRSMGYEGFVRMSSRRGFHLLLVEETADGFRPRFQV